MKHKRIISALLASVMATTALTGCGGGASNVAESTSQSANTDPNAPITMTFMCPSWDVSVPKAEQWLWEEYEKKSGVHIEWQEISQAAMVEKKSVLMASDDLPDAFWQFFAFSPEEVSMYGSQGVFVSLDDKLDKLPNLSALLDKDPTLRAAITMADGKIYGFPYVTNNKAELTCRYYLNKSYLEELNMTPPKTIDEFEAYMRGVKTLKTMDGADIYPFYDSPHTWWFTEMQLLGGYGLCDNGFQQYQTMVYNPGNDQLKFMYTDDRMKELWQRVAGWYQEGLLHPGTFLVDYDYPKWVSDGMEGKVGAFTWSSASFLYGGAEKDYVGINSLEGPYGNVTSWADTPSRSTVAGLITKDCKDIDRALQWFDYWYSDEAAKFGYAGIEGVTYTEKDGVYKYSEDIQSYDGGIQLGAFQKGLLTYGANYPFNEPTDMKFKMDLFNTTFEGMYGCTEADIAANYPKEVWPAFVATPEEVDVLNACYSDLNTFVNESRLKFMTGKWNFDSDWDAYVETINSIRVNDYVAVKQAQFERYRANMGK